ncbi:MAG: DUF938 domain-containing protein [Polyangiaceae bacterium]
MKQSSPAALRNRDPILEQLRQIFPMQGLVLEIASGTGEHVLHFAAALPQLTFQPTDANPASLESVRAHLADAALSNVLEPKTLDVCAEAWPVERADAIFCANMIHISPWEACVGLMRGAGHILSPGSALVTYGPYRFHGEFTAPSNEAFDRSLQQRDASWGVRDVDDVFACAESFGLRNEQILPMPANNHLLVFRRGPS